MIKAVWNGTVLAESERTVVVEGNHYFAVDCVNRAFLTDSDHHSKCFWKGTASYCNVVVDGQVNPNAAWYYPDPLPAANEIKGRIAFWRGVEVG